MFKVTILFLKIHKKKLTSFSSPFSIFREYIAYEFTCRFVEMDYRQVDLFIEKNIPKQSNAYDCGIFVCEYAENISRKADFNFSQNDTYLIRERIKTEIMLGTLIPDPLNI